MNAEASIKFLIAIFVVILATPAVIQTVSEARRGEWPQALQVLTQRPTAENLRSFENSLQSASLTARTLRPWMQAAQFWTLGDAGEKAIVGRDGWFFYQPGVQFLTQRATPHDSTPEDAIGAIVRFRDELAARKIQLLLVPAPNKESIYPDRLCRFGSVPPQKSGEETRRFFAKCQSAGLEVVDLFQLYRESRSPTKPQLYLTQDSHWSPAGMELAAQAVADRMLTRGWITRGTTRYEGRATPVARLGDIPRMSRSPQLEGLLKPEAVDTVQVINQEHAAIYADDPSSEVLVMGDSFLRIYQLDEPGGAGFVAHLARALGRPLASIINDGGASTLVRQELFRHPEKLRNAKVVVWEFVERDLRLGTEGWQLVPLPPESGSQHATKRAD